jgi:hypothetical protein
MLVPFFKLLLYLWAHLYKKSGQHGEMGQISALVTFGVGTEATGSHAANPLRISQLPIPAGVYGTW